MKKTTLYYISYIVLFAIFSFLLYTVEMQSKESTLHSFQDTFLFGFLNVLAVGYGGANPSTPLGQIIGLFFVITNVVFLGLIIGNLTTYFTEKKERNKMGYNGTVFENHIVIIGWDNFAKQILENLLQVNLKVGVIADEKNDVLLLNEEIQDKNLFVLHSNYDAITQFEKANISNASLIFINLHNDSEKLVTLLNLKRLYPNIKYLVVLEENQLAETFKSAGVTYALSRNEIAAKMIASYIFEPEVASYSVDLLSTAENNNEDYDIQQYKISSNSAFLKMTYNECFNLLKAEYNIALIGLSKGETLLKMPINNPIIETGDYIIIITSGNQSEKLSQFLNVKPGK